MGFETCGPNEAMVVSGCGYGRPLMIPGGRVWKWPMIQQIQRISLNTMTLRIKSENVNTQKGVPISCVGVAQVKIQGQNQEMLANACMQFLGKRETEIQNIALETLEGHQRAIMGNMTVEEIYQDRKKFAKQVFEVASSDLINMGITVVSYTLKDVTDSEGYLSALGKARTAQIHRDARIGEAEAKRDAGIKEALANQAKMKAKFENDAKIAESKRDFELKKAAYDKEVSTKKAESELAYNLQEAITKQSIKEAEMQIKVEERNKQIQVQEQEISRRDKELTAQVKKPAEAEKFRMERIAEAERNRIILEADATAQSIQMKGEAEAFAVEAKAKAEAEQMAKKADAWKDYQEAAMVDMVLSTLPKIAAEIAAPLSATKKITMVSSGKGDIGAAKLTSEVLDVVARLPAVVEKLTGVNMTKALNIKV
ncbi:flotillin-1-like [Styela clava]|uniref:flotillin-1-like n=1 Tax=Styela clava TaxID=7725 RepID=UPI001939EE11|nr:flotillin-1-like [Styela clava]XP_039264506.1 flotillin-1-like [Styela clava]